MRGFGRLAATRACAIALCAGATLIADGASAQLRPGGIDESPIVAATRLAPGSVDATAAAVRAAVPRPRPTAGLGSHILSASVRPLAAAGQPIQSRTPVTGFANPSRPAPLPFGAAVRDYKPVPSHWTPVARLSAGQITKAGDAMASDRPDRAFHAMPPLNPVLESHVLAGDPVQVKRGDHVDQRLGASTVRLAAGTRLGGGADYPSPEAVSYDPRDLLDYRVKALENQAVRQQP